MAANQPPWPHEWLMTDERLGNRLWEAVEALPAGAGIVFRHYATPMNERTVLASRLASLCRDRGLLLAVAGSVELAHLLQASLVHNPAGDAGAMPVSRSAHSLEQADLACSSGASLIFLSPIFATRSHPDRQPLPRETTLRVIAGCPMPVIALGGMNRARFAERKTDGFYGWAGIDAWLRT
jgi:thiamine-phosphate pyrophosphorylase